MIINSKENEISKLLKFVRTYKINIPVLYLENSITDGDIIYNIINNTFYINFFKFSNIDKPN